MIGLKLVIGYIYCVVKEPGYLTNQSTNSDYTLLYLLENIDAKDICPTCVAIKTPRSRHCNVCNKCVERYDSHSVWINNCIGIKNQLYYLSFLWFLWLDLLLAICVAIEGILFNDLIKVIYSNWSWSNGRSGKTTSRYSLSTRSFMCGVS